MSLADRLRKNSKIKETALIGKSKVFGKKEFITTQVPMLNVALSGEIYGGFKSGLTMFAGPSKHFKTMFTLVCVKAFLDKYPEGVVLWYDSEFGSPPEYFEAMGIDVSRVVHTPIANIEDLKNDIANQLEGIEKEDKVCICIDSIGNLASKKEVDDAIEGKSVADMTRAKQLKSLFRIVTPYLNLRDIPMFVVNHTYKEIGLYPKDIVGGGCVAAGTKVLMVDGSYRNIEDVLVGEFVETLGGSHEVTHTWNPKTLMNGTPECYEIEFEDGYKVICSENHRFMVDGEWIEARDLVEGVDCSVLNKDPVSR